MLITHITSFNNTSLFIWLSFASISLAILVSAVCACLTCCAWRQPLLCQHCDAELAIYLLVTSYANAADVEYEISYIATPAMSTHWPTLLPDHPAALTFKSKVVEWYSNKPANGSHVTNHIQERCANKSVSPCFEELIL